MESSEIEINDLPWGMLLQIFDFLPYLAERKVLALVCHQWNAAAFDRKYLRRINFSLELNKLSLAKLQTIKRPYRNMLLKYHRPLILNDAEVEEVLTEIEKLGSSLEQLQCKLDMLPATLVFRFVSKFPNLKELYLGFITGAPSQPLPILEKLTVLQFYLDCIPAVDVVRLAPHLRKLRAGGQLQDLPSTLVHLELKGMCNTNLFREYSNVTQLTSVVLYNRAYGNMIQQESLEQLCRCCPLLSKLWIDATLTTSLQCLVSLKNLKDLGIRNPGQIRDFMIIQALPLEKLKFVLFRNSLFNIDEFRNWSTIMNLTKLALHGSVPLGQENLEQLCRCCPLLSTLRFNAGETTSLQCLINLKNLEVLSLEDYHHGLIANSDFFLPNVETLEIFNPTTLHFDDAMNRLLPNVRFLKLAEGSRLHAPATIVKNCLPQLRKLEYIDFASDFLVRLLKELSNLQELILHHGQLVDRHADELGSTLLSLQQLTVVKGPVDITNKMIKLFPHLRFVNVARDCYMEIGNLPSTCIVRRNVGYVYDIYM